MRLFARCLALGALVFWMAVAATAQQQAATQTTKSWDSLVVRTQNAIDANTVSDSVLANLRDQIGKYRGTFDPSSVESRGRLCAGGWPDLTD